MMGFGPLNIIDIRSRKVLAPVDAKISPRRIFGRLCYLHGLLLRDRVLDDTYLLYKSSAC